MITNNSKGETLIIKLYFELAEKNDLADRITLPREAANRSKVFSYHHALPSISRPHLPPSRAT